MAKRALRNWDLATNNVKAGEKGGLASPPQEESEGTDSDAWWNEVRPSLGGARKDRPSPGYHNLEHVGSLALLPVPFLASLLRPGDQEPGHGSRAGLERTKSTPDAASSVMSVHYISLITNNK